ncbi:hypothetical protein ADUPG1_008510, partial [Aduncisulcus paluster]
PPPFMPIGSVLFSFLPSPSKTTPIPPIPPILDAQEVSSCFAGPNGLSSLFKKTTPDILVAWIIQMLEEGRIDTRDVEYECKWEAIFRNEREKAKAMRLKVLSETSIDNEITSPTSLSRGYVKLDVKNVHRWMYRGGSWVKNSQHYPCINETQGCTCPIESHSTPYPLSVSLPEMRICDVPITEPSTSTEQHEASMQSPMKQMDLDDPSNALNNIGYLRDPFTSNIPALHVVYHRMSAVVRDSMPTFRSRPLEEAVYASSHLFAHPMCYSSSMQDAVWWFKEGQARERSRRQDVRRVVETRIKLVQELIEIFRGSQQNVQACTVAPFINMLNVLQMPLITPSTPFHTISPFTLQELPPITPSEHSAIMVNLSSFLHVVSAMNVKQFTQMYFAYCVGDDLVNEMRREGEREFFIMREQMQKSSITKKSEVKSSSSTSISSKSKNKGASNRFDGSYDQLIRSGVWLGDPRNLHKNELSPLSPPPGDDMIETPSSSAVCPDNSMVSSDDVSYDSDGNPMIVDDILLSHLDFSQFWVQSLLSTQTCYSRSSCINPILSPFFPIFLPCEAFSILNSFLLYPPLYSLTLSHIHREAQAGWIGSYVASYEDGSLSEQRKQHTAEWKHLDEAYKSFCEDAENSISEYLKMFRALDGKKNEYYMAKYELSQLEEIRQQEQEEGGESGDKKSPNDLKRLRRERNKLVSKIDKLKKVGDKETEKLRMHQNSCNKKLLRLMREMKTSSEERQKTRIEDRSKFIQTISSSQKWRKRAIEDETEWTTMLVSSSFGSYSDPSSMIDKLKKVGDKETEKLRMHQNSCNKKLLRLMREMKTSSEERQKTRIEDRSKFIQTISSSQKWRKRAIEDETEWTTMLVSSSFGSYSDPSSMVSFKGLSNESQCGESQCSEQEKGSHSLGKLNDDVQTQASTCVENTPSYPLPPALPLLLKSKPCDCPPPSNSKRASVLSAGLCGLICRSLDICRRVSDMEKYGLVVGDAVWINYYGDELGSFLNPRKDLGKLQPFLLRHIPMVFSFLHSFLLASPHPSSSIIKSILKAIKGVYPLLEHRCRYDFSNKILSPISNMYDRVFLAKLSRENDAFVGDLPYRVLVNTMFGRLYARLLSGRCTGCGGFHCLNNGTGDRVKSAILDQTATDKALKPITDMLSGGSNALDEGEDEDEKKFDQKGKRVILAKSCPDLIPPVFPHKSLTLKAAYNLLHAMIMTDEVSQIKKKKVSRNDPFYSKFFYRIEHSFDDREHDFEGFDEYIEKRGELYNELEEMREFKKEEKECKQRIQENKGEELHREQEDVRILTACEPSSSCETQQHPTSNHIPILSTPYAWRVFENKGEELHREQEDVRILTACEPSSSCETQQHPTSNHIPILSTPYAWRVFGPYAMEMLANYGIKSVQSPSEYNSVTSKAGKSSASQEDPQTDVESTPSSDDKLWKHYCERIPKADQSRGLPSLDDASSSLSNRSSHHHSSASSPDLYDLENILSKTSILLLSSDDAFVSMVSVLSLRILYDLDNPERTRPPCRELQSVLSPHDGDFSFSAVNKIPEPPRLDFIVPFLPLLLHHFIRAKKWNGIEAVLEMWLGFERMEERPSMEKTVDWHDDVIHRIHTNSVKRARNQIQRFVSPFASRPSLPFGHSMPEFHSLPPIFINNNPLDGSSVLFDGTTIDPSASFVLHPLKEAPKVSSNEVWHDLVRQSMSTHSPSQQTKVPNLSSNDIVTLALFGGDGMMNMMKKHDMITDTMSKTTKHGSDGKYLSQKNHEQIFNHHRLFFSPSSYSLILPPLALSPSLQTRRVLTLWMRARSVLGFLQGPSSGKVSNSLVKADKVTDLTDPACRNAIQEVFMLISELPPSALHSVLCERPQLAQLLSSVPDGSPQSMMQFLKGLSPRALAEMARGLETIGKDITLEQRLVEYLSLREKYEHSSNPSLLVDSEDENKSSKKRKKGKSNNTKHSKSPQGSPKDISSNPASPPPLPLPSPKPPKGSVNERDLYEILQQMYPTPSPLTCPEDEEAIRTIASTANLPLSSLSLLSVSVSLLNGAFFWPEWVEEQGRNVGLGINWEEEKRKRLKKRKKEEKKRRKEMERMIMQQSESEEKKMMVAKSSEKEEGEEEEGKDAEFPNMTVHKALPCVPSFVSGLNMPSFSVINGEIDKEKFMKEQARVIVVKDMINGTLQDRYKRGQTRRGEIYLSSSDSESSSDASSSKSIVRYPHQSSIPARTYLSGSGMIEALVPSSPAQSLAFTPTAPFLQFSLLFPFLPESAAHHLFSPLFKLYSEPAGPTALHQDFRGAHIERFNDYQAKQAVWWEETGKASLEKVWRKEMEEKKKWEGKMKGMCGNAKLLPMPCLLRPLSHHFKEFPATFSLAFKPWDGVTPPSLLSYSDRSEVPRFDSNEIPLLSSDRIAKTYAFPSSLTVIIMHTFVTILTKELMDCVALNEFRRLEIDDNISIVSGSDSTVYQDTPNQSPTDGASICADQQHSCPKSEKEERDDACECIYEVCGNCSITNRDVEMNILSSLLSPYSLSSSVPLSKLQEDIIRRVKHAESDVFFVIFDSIKPFAVHWLCAVLFYLENEQLLQEDDRLSNWEGGERESQSSSHQQNNDTRDLDTSVSTKLGPDQDGVDVYDDDQRDEEEAVIDDHSTISNPQESFIPTPASFDPSPLLFSLMHSKNKDVIQRSKIGYFSLEILQSFLRELVVLLVLLASKEEIRIPMFFWIIRPILMRPALVHLLSDYNGQPHLLGLISPFLSDSIIRPILLRHVSPYISLLYESTDERDTMSMQSMFKLLYYMCSEPSCNASSNHSSQSPKIDENIENAFIFIPSSLLSPPPSERLSFKLRENLSLRSKWREILSYESKSRTSSSSSSSKNWIESEEYGTLKPVPCDPIEDKAISKFATKYLDSYSSISFNLCQHMPKNIKQIPNIVNNMGAIVFSRPKQKEDKEEHDGKMSESLSEGDIKRIKYSSCCPLLADEEEIMEELECLDISTLNGVKLPKVTTKRNLSSLRLSFLFNHLYILKLEFEKEAVRIEENESDRLFEENVEKERCKRSGDQLMETWRANVSMDNPLDSTSVNPGTTGTTGAASKTLSGSDNESVGRTESSDVIDGAQEEGKTDMKKTVKTSAFSPSELLHYLSSSLSIQSYFSTIRTDVREEIAHGSPFIHSPTRVELLFDVVSKCVAGWKEKECVSLPQSRSPSESISKETQSNPHKESLQGQGVDVRWELFLSMVMATDSRYVPIPQSAFMCLSLFMIRKGTKKECKSVCRCLSNLCVSSKIRPIICDHVYGALVKRISEENSRERIKRRNISTLMEMWEKKKEIMMKLYEEMKGKPSEEKKMDSSHSNSEIHLPCFPAIGYDNPFLSMGVSLLLSSYLCSMWTFIPLLSNLCLIDGMKQKIVNDLFNVFPYWAETIADVDGWDGEGQIMEMFMILMVNLALCKDNHPKLRPLQEIVLKIARSYKKLSIKERCVLFLNMIEE